MRFARAGRSDTRIPESIFMELFEFVIISVDIILIKQIYNAIKMHAVVECKWEIKQIQNEFLKNKYVISLYSCSEDRRSE